MLKNLKKSKIIQICSRIAKIPFFIPYYFIVHFKFKFDILSPQETSFLLFNKNLSISRFGDGEFNIILRNKSIDFQPYSVELKANLLKILDNKSVNLALPHGLKSTKNDKLTVKTFWWMYVTLHYREIIEFVEKTGQKKFLDTNFSRTITELKDRKVIDQTLFNTKKIWENKHVVIIEGHDTRFGVGNDLLSRALDITRILAPSKNAFLKIDEIKSVVVDILQKNNKLKNWSRSNTVVLAALGPTASVIVGQLSLLAQCIDIGHFDLQYEYLLQGKYRPTRISTRFDNENRNGERVSEVTDKQYLDSIYINISGL